jgi:hypothetical protein
VVARVASRHPSVLALEERDIETDESLFRAYLERIPVVTIDGEEAFEFAVEEQALERRLGIVRTG